MTRYQRMKQAEARKRASHNFQRPGDAESQRRKRHGYKGNRKSVRSKWSRM